MRHSVIPAASATNLKLTFFDPWPQRAIQTHFAFVLLEQISDFVLLHCSPLVQEITELSRNVCVETARLAADS